MTTSIIPLVDFARAIDLDWTDSQGERRHAGYTGCDVHSRAACGLAKIRSHGGRAITATITTQSGVESVRLDD